MHQTINISGLLDRVEPIIGKRLNKSDFAELVYAPTKCSPSYARYRLSQLTHGKSPMTLKDLSLFGQAIKGIDQCEILQYINLNAKEQSHEDEKTNRKTGRGIKAVQQGRASKRTRNERA